MEIKFFNDFHLGDCFWHALWMRKQRLARPDISFLLRCNPCYHHQLDEITRDVGGVEFTSGQMDGEGWRDAWIGQRWGDRSLWDGVNVVDFLRLWFRKMSEDLWLPDVFQDNRSLLADYPALQPAAGDQKFDFLVVNSDCQSGQLANDKASMDRICWALSRQGSVITTQKTDGFPCTQEAGSTISGIGRIAAGCRMTVGAATAPLHATLNTSSSRQGSHIVILNGLRLDYGFGHPHFNSVSECADHIEKITA